MYKKIIGVCGAIILSSNLYAEAQLQPTTSSEQQTVLMEEIQRFSIALGLIKQYYVKPIDEKTLFEGAIRGMLSGLDPHSSYLDAHEFQELATLTDGNFGGLGLEVTLENEVIKVISALVDTPAYKAGIKPGDYIIKIGTQIVQGMDLKNSVELMRGKPGSTVELTILRKNANNPLVFNLTREKIQIKSVSSNLLENKYGYIRVTQFQQTTNQDLLQALTTLKQTAPSHQLNGLVLDLRNNPGGLLDSAIQVAGAFLNKENNGTKTTIVSTMGRLPGSKFTAFANSEDQLKNAPIVVLINGGSASASEIVAGALQDNHRAVIVGTKSFGKGSVQTVLPLDESRGIKLTTALYYTPNGNSIQAKGITPDVIIDELNIVKSDKPELSSNFSEAGLKGHIDNPNMAEKKLTTNNKVETKASDSQLQMALMVLKGLAVTSKKQNIQQNSTTKLPYGI